MNREDYLNLPERTGTLLARLLVFCIAFVSRRGRAPVTAHELQDHEASANFNCMKTCNEKQQTMQGVLAGISIFVIGASLGSGGLELGDGEAFVFGLAVTILGVFLWVRVSKGLGI